MNVFPAERRVCGPLAPLPLSVACPGSRVALPCYAAAALHFPVWQAARCTPLAALCCRLGAAYPKPVEDAVNPLDAAIMWRSDALSPGSNFCMESWVPQVRASQPCMGSI